MKKNNLFTKSFFTFSLLTFCFLPQIASKAEAWSFSENICCKEGSAFNGGGLAAAFGGGGGSGSGNGGGSGFGGLYNNDGGTVAITQSSSLATQVANNFNNDLRNSGYTAVVSSNGQGGFSVKSIKNDTGSGGSGSSGTGPVFIPITTCPSGQTLVQEEKTAYVCAFPTDALSVDMCTAPRGSGKGARSTVPYPATLKTEQVFICKPIICPSGQTLVQEDKTTYTCAFATDALSGNMCTAPRGSGKGARSTVPYPATATVEKIFTCKANSACLNVDVSYIGYTQIINNKYIYKNGQGPTPFYTASSTTASSTCNIFRNSSDGSKNINYNELYTTNKTNWTNQAAKNYPYTEDTSVKCANNPALLNDCSYKIANAKVAHPKWNQPCNSAANVCGVVTTGVYNEDGVCTATVVNNPTTCSVTNACGQVRTGYNCPAGCTLNGSPLSAVSNDTCITLTPSTTSVPPGGSVNFTWRVTPLNPGIGRKCGFTDLSKPVGPNGLGTPIPGLQDLDPAKESARINNIQTNTRFCLVCTFYNISNGSAVGLPAAIHQWIRVIRIGES